MGLELIHAHECSFYCIDLSCFLPENVFLRSLDSGLSLFIKANQLHATDGISPSCLMNKQHLISKFHLRHLTRINSSHLAADNGDMVTQDCLEDYTQCDKDEELRKITKEDLIENNMLISPAKKDGYRIQCINTTEDKPNIVRDIRDYSKDK